MRLLPGAGRALFSCATGLALALFVAGGAAAAQGTPPKLLLSEPCPPKPTAPLSPNALFKCFYAAQVRATHAAQHEVAFETQDDATPQTASLFADAATVTSRALVRIAERPGGASVLARLTTARFIIGGEPAANLADGVLTITIAPQRGMAGRPSTRQIEEAARRPN
jgi:hypothetical protein